jgi:hypothetical protein
VVFPLGYLSCERSLAPLDGSFFWLTVLDMAACALLLSRLSAPLTKTLWAWAILLVYIDGLFLKMFWFSWKINSPEYINARYGEQRWVGRARILEGYSWMTFGFVVFCAAAAAVITRSRTSPEPVREAQRPLMGRQALHLLVGVFAVYLLTSLIQVRLGLGLLGGAASSLPLHLGTLINLFRQDLAPGLMLLCVWVLDRVDRQWGMFATGVIIVSAMIDSYLSTSRGILLLTVLPIYFLWLLTGRMTRGRKAGLAVVALAVVVLFPTITALRYKRLGVQTAAAPHSGPVQQLSDSAF